MFLDKHSDAASEIRRNYFAPENRKQLVLQRNGTVVGKVDVFSHIGGMVVPVGALAGLLKLDLKVDVASGSVTGTLPNGDTITMVVEKNQILIAGTATTQVSSLMFVQGNEVYVDATMLGRLYLMTFSVDSSAGVLRVSDHPGPAAATTGKAKHRPAVPVASEPLLLPETGPVTSGGIAADTAVLAVTSEEIAPAEKPAPAEKQPPAAKQTVAAATKTGEEPLVLQLVLNNVPMVEFVEGFRRDGQLFLPLSQLASLLDFAITVNAKSRAASGWFIREDNHFALTPDSVSINGDTSAVPSGAVVVKSGDLFIASDSLRQWFPLDFDVDSSRMTLSINAREALPFEEQQRRQKMRAALDMQKSLVKEAPSYKMLEYPYQAASWPFVNLDIGSSYETQSSAQRTDYSLLATGDLGYLTSRVYAAGNLNDDALSDLRLTFGREDYEGKQLGFARASTFSFGDTDSVGLALVGTPSAGRGFNVSNRALNRSDKFDVTSFIGDSTPGREVELYRNGVLIDSQVVGTDGRYEFRDVPILYGNNSFRLAFFGAQGQVDEIVKDINAGGSLLNQGEFTYNFSADEEGKTLFGIVDSTNPNAGGLRTVGEVEYGLNRWLTLAAGGAHMSIRDEDHNYATAGVRTSFAGVLASLDTAYDTSTQGYSSRLSMFGDYLSTNLHFQQKIANNFTSEESGIVSDLITSVTDIGLDRQSDLPLLGDLNSGLSFVRKRYESGRIEDLWINRLSKSIYGVSFTNSLQRSSDNLGTSNFTGTTSMRGFLGGVLLGAQMDYALQPETDFNLFKLTGNYPIASGISGYTALSKDYGASDRTAFEDTVTFDVNKYKLSFTGRADSENNYFAGVFLNLSFGRVPGSDEWLFSSRNMAETGTVAVRPYLDRNYNQLRDEGEEAPPNTAIRIGSQTLKASADTMAIAKGLPVNTPVSIKLDQEKLDSAFLTSGNDEYRVVPRTGTAYVVDYPVFEASQVDGTVRVPSGSAKALEVELVTADGEVVATALTSFDGYFLLQGIKPGSYWVRVASSSLERRHLEQPLKRTIAIREADFYSYDIELVVRKS